MIEMMRPGLYYAVVISYPADICAIGCMDGSWWIDWPRFERFAALDIPHEPRDAVVQLLARALLAAKGNLQEVPRERAEELGAEYARRMEE